MQKQDCKCISCLKIGSTFYLGFSQLHQCRMLGCSFSAQTDWSIWGHKGPLLAHERSHFGVTGKYSCAEPNCDTTTKKFSDLKRHYAGKHCVNATKTLHPCPVPYCQYGGKNGFKRKDKLKSHYKNIHEGKMTLPTGTQRTIRPKDHGVSPV